LKVLIESGVYRRGTSSRQQLVENAPILAIYPRIKTKKRLTPCKNQNVSIKKEVFIHSLSQQAIDYQSEQSVYNTKFKSTEGR